MRPDSLFRWSVCAILLAACGDDDGPSPPAPDSGPLRDSSPPVDSGPARDSGAADLGPSSDAGPDGALPMGRLDVVVRVAAGRFGGEMGEPLAGATVVLDPPGGGARVEQTTDSMGRTTFTGLDWAAGSASVTGWLTGHFLGSVLGIEQADGEVSLPLAPEEPDPGDTVVVSGAFLGATAGHQVQGWALGTPSASWNNATAGYRFEIPRGEARTLLFREVTPFVAGPDYVVESPGWSLHELPPITTSTALDIDLVADRIEAERVRGSVRLVSRPGSVLGSAEVFVLPGAIHSGTVAGYSVGWYTEGRHAGAGIYDYEVDFARVLPEDEVFASYGIFTAAPDGPTSFVLEPGYPTAGVRSFEFLDVPTFDEPAEGTTGRLHDPVRFTIHGELGPSLLTLSRGNASLWTVRFPEGWTELTVPELPPSVSADTALGPRPLQAALFTCEPGDSGFLGAGCVRRSTSAPVELVP